MPKRPADERGGGRSAKIPRRRRRRHLYLVLDDWERGYSIRKLDLSSSSSSSDTDSGDAQHHHHPSDDSTTEPRLPPAVFRLEAPRACTGLFAAFGTRIMATHLTPRRTVPMFDVRKKALTFGPFQESHPNPTCGAFVEADGKLFLLDDMNFMVLDPPPPPQPMDLFLDLEFDWRWRGGLPAPPFTHYVVAHAVHPDGRTIFFSTEKQTRKRTKVATFAFDAARSRWTRHGGWRLPFADRGCFDRELDAWVGISGDPDTLGHLCACQTVSTASDDAEGESSSPAPAWKLSKEKLFCVGPAEKHVGATLVSMGGRGKFCVVHCVSMDDGREGHVSRGRARSPPERPRYLLRVTTFSLKYDHDGDLRAGMRRRVRSYRLPETATLYCDGLEKPVAFWM
ncbi:hypothetical protein ACP70R_026832 [Stipagrostis hirtigluma subsp. patula]